VPSDTSRLLIRWREFGSAVKRDWTVNSRDPKARAVLLSFRGCQFLMGDQLQARPIAIPAIVLHRFVTEFILGIELRPKTRIGCGLRIYHGTGLVVNDNSVIGKEVILRNGVTIGHQFPGGGSPVIGDNVSIGAGAILLGEIIVGNNAVIGAGTVLTKSVPPGAVVVGNPARVLRIEEFD
jgi:putative colanic acid biosynthesis acetyltransferase WcaB